MLYKSCVLFGVVHQVGDMRRIRKTMLLNKKQKEKEEDKNNWYLPLSLSPLLFPRHSSLLLSFSPSLPRSLFNLPFLPLLLSAYLSDMKSILIIRVPGDQLLDFLTPLTSPPPSSPSSSFSPSLLLSFPPSLPRSLSSSLLTFLTWNPFSSYILT